MSCNQDCSQGRRCICSEEYRNPPSADPWEVIGLAALALVWFVLAMIGLGVVVRWLV